MNFNEQGPKRDLGIEDPVRRDEGCGGKGREERGKNCRGVTRRDGGMKASRNPVFVSRERQREREG